MLNPMYSRPITPLGKTPWKRFKPVSGLTKPALGTVAPIPPVADSAVDMVKQPPIAPAVMPRGDSYFVGGKPGTKGVVPRAMGMAPLAGSRRFKGGY